MKINNIFIALLIGVASTSCVKDLLDTNKNPNESQVPQPDYLLTNAIKSSVDTYWGTTNNLDGTLLFVQQVAKIQRQGPNRHPHLIGRQRENRSGFNPDGINCPWPADKDPVVDFPIICRGLNRFRPIQAGLDNGFLVFDIFLGS